MPKIEKPTKNILRLREDGEFGQMYKIVEIICFSASVRQCNAAYGVMRPVRLCF